MDKGEASEKNNNEERLFDETIFKEHLKNKLILLFDSVKKYIFLSLSIVFYIFNPCIIKIPLFAFFIFLLFFFIKIVPHILNFILMTKRFQVKKFWSLIQMLLAHSIYQSKIQL